MLKEIDEYCLPLSVLYVIYIDSAYNCHFSSTSTLRGWAQVLNVDNWFIQWIIHYFFTECFISITTSALSIPSPHHVPLGINCSYIFDEIHIFFYFDTKHLRTMERAAMHQRPYKTVSFPNQTWAVKHNALQIFCWCSKSVKRSVRSSNSMHLECLQRKAAKGHGWKRGLPTTCSMVGEEAAMFVQATGVMDQCLQLDPQAIAVSNTTGLPFTLSILISQRTLP